MDMHRARAFIPRLVSAGISRIPTAPTRDVSRRPASAARRGQARGGSSPAGLRALLPPTTRQRIASPFRIHMASKSPTHTHTNLGDSATAKAAHKSQICIGS